MSGRSGCGTYSAYVGGCRCDPCRSANRAYKRDHYLKNRDLYLANSRDSKRRPHYRRRGLLRKYGMTLDDWSAMLADQGEACAICRTEEPGGRWGQWQVDHDHKSGLVRGLLCADCNLGLGRFKDSIAHLAAAATYLGSADGLNQLEDSQ